MAPEDGNNSGRASSRPCVDGLNKGNGSVVTMPMPAMNVPLKRTTNTSMHTQGMMRT